MCKRLHHVAQHVVGWNICKSRDTRTRWKKQTRKKKRSKGNKYEHRTHWNERRQIDRKCFQQPTCNLRLRYFHIYFGLWKVHLNGCVHSIASNLSDWSELRIFQNFFFLSIERYQIAIDFGHTETHTFRMESTHLSFYLWLSFVIITATMKNSQFFTWVLVQRLLSVLAMFSVFVCVCVRARHCVWRQ